MTLQIIRVKGICPACQRDDSLMVHPDKGEIHCSSMYCPEPSSLHDIINDPDQHVHLVTLHETGFWMVHPMDERLHPLEDCLLHRLLKDVDGPPWPINKEAALGQPGGEFAEPGRYRVVSESLPSDEPGIEHGHNVWTKVEDQG